MSEDPRRAHHAVGAVFVVHAALFASWTAHIPAVKDALGLTNAGLGTALLGAPLGSVAAMLISRWLLPRWGSRRLVRVMLVGYAFAGIAVGQSYSGSTLFAALAVWGLFQGGVDVAMNTQAVTIERELGRPVMSRLHGLWSIGAFTGALIGAGSVTIGLSLSLQLLILGAGALAVTGAMTRWLIADPNTAPGRELSGSTGPRRMWMVIGVLGGVSFASMLCEGAAADWSANFLRSEIAAPPGIAGLGYAGYALAMVAARLGGPALQTRIPTRVLVPTLALVACGGTTAAVLTSHLVVALIGFACLGMGVALVVPTAFSAAGTATADAGNAGAVISLVAAMGWIGYVSGPPVIGHLAAVVGLRGALVLLPVATLGIALATRLCPQFTDPPVPRRADVRS